MDQQPQPSTSAFALDSGAKKAATRSLFCASTATARKSIPISCRKQVELLLAIKTSPEETQKSVTLKISSPNPSRSSPRLQKREKGQSLVPSSGIRKLNFSENTYVNKFNCSQVSPEKVEEIKTSKYPVVTVGPLPKEYIHLTSPSPKRHTPSLKKTPEQRDSPRQDEAKDGNSEMPECSSIKSEHPQRNIFDVFKGTVTQIEEQANEKESNTLPCATNVRSVKEVSSDNPDKTSLIERCVDAKPKPKTNLALNEKSLELILEHVIFAKPGVAGKARKSITKKASGSGVQDTTITSTHVHDVDSKSLGVAPISDQSSASSCDVQSEVHSQLANVYEDALAHTTVTDDNTLMIRSEKFEPLSQVSNIQVYDSADDFKEQLLDAENIDENKVTAVSVSQTKITKQDIEDLFPTKDTSPNDDPDNGVSLNELKNDIPEVLLCTETMPDGEFDIAVRADTEDRLTLLKDKHLPEYKCFVSAEPSLEVLPSFDENDYGDDDYSMDANDDLSLQDSQLQTPEKRFLATENNLEKTPEIEKIKPDFDEVQGMLFMSFSSKDAMSAHSNVEAAARRQLGVKHVDFLKDISQYHALDMQKCQDKMKDKPRKGLGNNEYRSMRGIHKRIRKYEQMLKCELRKIKSHNTLHPDLKKGGVSLDEGLVVSLNLKDLGIELNPPPQIQSQSYDIPGYVSPKGKTTDITKIKGWRNKFGMTEDDDENDNECTPRQLFTEHNKEPGSVEKQIGLKNLVESIKKKNKKKKDASDESNKPLPQSASPQKNPVGVVENEALKNFEKMVTTSKSAFVSNTLDAYLEEQQKTNTDQGESFKSPYTHPLLQSKTSSVTFKVPTKPASTQKIKTLQSVLAKKGITLPAFSSNGPRTSVSTKQQASKGRLMSKLKDKINRSTTKSSKAILNKQSSKSPKKDHPGDCIHEQKENGTVSSTERDSFPDVMYYKGNILVKNTAEKNRKLLTEGTRFKIIDSRLVHQVETEPVKTLTPILPKKAKKRKVAPDSIGKAKDNVVTVNQALAAVSALATGEPMLDEELVLGSTTQIPVTKKVKKVKLKKTEKMVKVKPADKKQKQHGILVSRKEAGRMDAIEEEIPIPQKPDEQPQYDPLHSMVYAKPVNGTLITVSECQKDMCCFGCVCSSINKPYIKIPKKDHCGKEECMLECQCAREQYEHRSTRIKKRPSYFKEQGMLFYDGEGMFFHEEPKNTKVLWQAATSQLSQLNAVSKRQKKVQKDPIVDVVNTIPPLNVKLSTGILYQREERYSESESSDNSHQTSTCARCTIYHHKRRTRCRCKNCRAHENSTFSTTKHSLSKPEDGQKENKPVTKKSEKVIVTKCLSTSSTSDPVVISVRQCIQPLLPGSSVTEKIPDTQSQTTYCTLGSISSLQTVSQPTHPVVPLVDQNKKIVTKDQSTFNQNSSHSFTSSKLIEVVADCDWRNRQKEIMECIARHKGTSGHMRVGKYKIEILPQGSEISRGEKLKTNKTTQVVPTNSQKVLTQVVAPINMAVSDVPNDLPVLTTKGIPSTQISVHTGMTNNTQTVTVPFSAVLASKEGTKKTLKPGQLITFKQADKVLVPSIVSNATPAIGSESHLKSLNEMTTQSLETFKTSTSMCQSNLSTTLTSVPVTSTPTSVSEKIQPEIQLTSVALPGSSTTVISQSASSISSESMTTTCKTTVNSTTTLASSITVNSTTTMASSTTDEIPNHLRAVPLPTALLTTAALTKSAWSTTGVTSTIQSKMSDAPVSTSATFIGIPHPSDANRTVLLPLPTSSCRSEKQFVVADGLSKSSISSTSLPKILNNKGEPVNIPVGATILLPTSVVGDRQVLKPLNVVAPYQNVKPPKNKLIVPTLDPIEENKVNHPVVRVCIDDIPKGITMTYIPNTSDQNFGVATDSSRTHIILKMENGFQVDTGGIVTPTTKQPPRTASVVSQNVSSSLLGFSNTAVWSRTGTPSTLTNVQPQPDAVPSPAASSAASTNAKLNSPHTQLPFYRDVRGFKESSESVQEATKGSSPITKTITAQTITPPVLAIQKNITGAPCTTTLSNTPPVFAIQKNNTGNRASLVMVPVSASTSKILKVSLIPHSATVMSTTTANHLISSSSNLCRTTSQIPTTSVCRIESNTTDKPVQLSALTVVSSTAVASTDSVVALRTGVVKPSAQHTATFTVSQMGSLVQMSSKISPTVEKKDTTPQSASTRPGIFKLIRPVTTEVQLQNLPLSSSSSEFSKHVATSAAKQQHTTSVVQTSGVQVSTLPTSQCPVVKLGTANSLDNTCASSTVLDKKLTNPFTEVKPLHSTAQQSHMLTIHPTLPKTSAEVQSCIQIVPEHPSIVRVKTVQKSSLSSLTHPTNTQINLPSTCSQIFTNVNLATRSVAQTSQSTSAMQPLVQSTDDSPLKGDQIPAQTYRISSCGSTGARHFPFETVSRFSISHKPSDANVAEVSISSATKKKEGVNESEPLKKKQISLICEEEMAPSDEESCKLGSQKLLGNLDLRPIKHTDEDMDVDVETVDSGIVPLQTDNDVDIEENSDEELQSVKLQSFVGQQKESTMVQQCMLQQKPSKRKRKSPVQQKMNLSDETTFTETVRAVQVGPKQAHPKRSFILHSFKERERRSFMNELFNNLKKMLWGYEDERIAKKAVLMKCGAEIKALKSEGKTLAKRRQEQYDHRKRLYIKLLMELEQMVSNQSVDAEHKKTLIQRVKSMYGKDIQELKQKEKGRKPKVGQVDVLETPVEANPVLVNEQPRSDKVVDGAVVCKKNSMKVDYNEESAIHVISANDLSTDTSQPVPVSLTMATDHYVNHHSEDISTTSTQDNGSDSTVLVVGDDGNITKMKMVTPEEPEPKPRDVEKELAKIVNELNLEAYKQGPRIVKMKLGVDTSEPVAITVYVGAGEKLTIPPPGCCEYNVIEHGVAEQLMEDSSNHNISGNEEEVKTMDLESEMVIKIEDNDFSESEERADLETDLTACQDGLETTCDDPGLKGIFIDDALNSNNDDDDDYSNVSTDYIDGRMLTEQEDKIVTRTDNESVVKNTGNEQTSTDKPCIKSMKDSEEEKSNNDETCETNISNNCDEPSTPLISVLEFLKDPTSVIIEADHSNIDPDPDSDLEEKPLVMDEQ
uniref:Uncharacterized protein LOC102804467 n=1 Tax=Saccoglossus kowalevskii TaxID=10224 RepID=A0ABM0M170_SACKO|nr:PREDICTED: uncharacterized protein LOC102804467 [Saccoglossus kowalevskii]